jgi:malate dehydrogenase (oxaloacetate-decarboxylating)(NADP+)
MTSELENRGYAILRDPHRNRGTAFTDAERRDLGLEGLLPPVPTSLERQVARIHAQLAALTDDLQKYCFCPICRRETKRCTTR